MKIFLGTILFILYIPLLICTLIVAYQINGIPQKLVFFAIFLFLLMLGSVAAKIHFFSARKYKDSLSTDPIESDSFRCMALEYFESRARILRIACLFMIGFSILANFISVYANTPFGIWYHVLVFFLPIGTAYKFYTQERLIHNCIRILQSNYSKVTIEDILRLSSLQQTDEISQIIKTRIEEWSSNSHSNSHKRINF